MWIQPINSESLGRIKAKTRNQRGIPWVRVNIGIGMDWLPAQSVSGRPQRLQPGTHNPPVKNFRPVRCVNPQPARGHLLHRRLITMATDKKVALVTGANRGIGFETARQLGQKGVTVFVGARSLKSAEETASKLKTEGIEAFPVKLDVTNAQDREAVAKTIGDKFGKLDILVNNAGVGAEDGILTPKTVHTTEKELQTVFGTNLFA